MKNIGSKLNFIVLALVVGVILLVNIDYDVTPNQNLPIDSGDTAWMIVACAFVLLMTPGLAFFLRWHGQYQKYYFNHATKFCSARCD